MPVQGYLVLGGLGLNYVASRLGKPTISRFCARHKALTIAATVVAAVWFEHHIATYVLPALEAFDDDRPEC